MPDNGKVEKILDGKVVIVTGGGGGIGSEICKYIARLGAKVVVNDIGADLEGKGRDPSVADLVVEMLRNENYEAVADYNSITSEEGARNVVRTALENFGKVHGLVNCAGNMKDKFTLDMSYEDFESVIKVNLIGAFLIGKECLSVMVEQNEGGSIINMTSVSGILGGWGQCAFASAKAGLIGLTKTWAVEFAKYGIRANLVAPTARTRMTKSVPLGDEEKLHPKHVAPVVAFLLSDLSRNINGSLIAVYGTKLFTYHVIANEGITNRGEMWTPQDIKSKVNQIFEI